MQKRYIWLTDTHFDFINRNKLFDFFALLRQLKCDGIFISGDVSTGKHLSEHISLLLKATEIPIYWVNGNHDIYKTNFTAISKQMNNLMEDDGRLHYLTDLNCIELSKSVGLIGHDGWYDARWRAPLTNIVFYADFSQIEDFKKLKNNNERIQLARKLADEAASSISTKLTLALAKYDTIYMITHFPPWPDDSNNLLSKFWMPYNSSKVMADVIKNTMKQYPNKNLIILSGHTHHKRNVKISENIELRVGASTLTKPEIQDIIMIE